MLTKKQQAYRFMTFTLILLWCAIIGGIILSLILSSSPTAIISQVGLQRTRSERITKDALLIVRFPNSPYITQATNELQVLLPLWEQTEIALQTRNASPGLPAPPPTDIIILATQAQPDFLAIDDACIMILHHPTDTSPIATLQLRIILDHEVAYYYQIGKINLQWGIELDQSTLLLRQLEIGITCAIILTAIMGFIFVSRAGQTKE